MSQAKDRVPFALHACAMMMASGDPPEAVSA